MSGLPAKSATAAVGASCSRNSPSALPRPLTCTVTCVLPLTTAGVPRVKVTPGSAVSLSAAPLSSKPKSAAPSVAVFTASLNSTRKTTSVSAVRPEASTTVPRVTDSTFGPRVSTLSPLRLAPVPLLPTASL